MKIFEVSESEKKRILEMHHAPGYMSNSGLPGTDGATPPTEGDVNELDIWDADNLKALKSHIGQSESNKVYKIEVIEPFSFETKDSEEFYKMKFMLNRSRAKYTDNIKEI